MRILSSKAQETVVLGNPVSHESNASSQELTTTLNSEHSALSLTNGHLEEPKELDLRKENDKNNDDFVSLPSTTKRAPKKIVSINERVEDIDAIMKERRKRKGTKKSKSFDFDNGYDASLKPTRSILKVGSIRDNSDLLKTLWMVLG